MQPFFSIITPVYNCRKYLRNCVESVLHQTFTSWELILVDDGSTDSSGRICDDFCYDERIKVIHQDNEGQLSSRLKGLGAAKGSYALGLDADDYLDRKCLETVKKAIDISGSDMVFFGYRNIGYQRNCVQCSLKAEKIYSKREVLKEVIEKTNHSLWNKAIRVDKIKQAEYSGLSKRLDINEDYVQIISILCEIDTVYVIDDILYNYRIDMNSISHAYKIKHIWDTDYASRYVIYKLKKSSLMDKEMHDIILRAYLRMIRPRISGLFCNKDISREDCRKIHQSRIYKMSKEVETLSNFNKNDFKLLKLFRYKQYWIIKLIVLYQKNILRRWL